MDASGRFVLEHGVGVFNGDVGYIREIDEFDQKLVVEYEDGRIVDYLYSQLDELEHAYAITIHKSQREANIRLLFFRFFFRTAETAEPESALYSGNAGKKRRCCSWKY